MGLKKYVTEKQVIDYYEKVGQDKNLKLTWIKNFGRIIPERIFEIKKEIDELKGSLTIILFFIMIQKMMVQN